MKKFLKGFLLFFVLIVGFILFALSNQIGGWRAFIVSSASMEPTINTGSLVLTLYTHPSALQNNDVITFIAPNKKRTIVTHRIIGKSHKEGLSTFQTKGDNNATKDTWILAGGGVIGKVVYTIPYLGYLFSFSQTKIGILLFILLPAVYIIIDEITHIFRLLRKKKIEPAPEVVAGIVILFSNLFLFTPAYTQALLSDTTTLTNNTFIVSIPTISSACNGNTFITIANNGAGSTNLVTSNSLCQTTVTQSNIHEATVN